MDDLPLSFLFYSVISFENYIPIVSGLEDDTARCRRMILSALKSAVLLLFDNDLRKWFGRAWELPASCTCALHDTTRGETHYIYSFLCKL